MKILAKHSNDRCSLDSVILCINYYTGRIGMAEKWLSYFYKQ